MKQKIQKLVIVTFVSFGFIQMHAQKNVQEANAKRLERMSKHLELSDDQITQIKNINTQYADQENALHEKIKANRMVKSDRKEMKEEVQAILTPEQKKKFKHMRKKSQKSLKKGGKKHFEKGDQRLNKMKQYLELSDVQVTQIKSIQEKYKPTETEKAEIKALMEKKKMLREKKMGEIKEVLNPEQKVKMEKMQKRMKKRFNKQKKHNNLL